MNKYLSALVAMLVLTNSAVYAVKDVVEEEGSKKARQAIPMSPMKKGSAISKLWERKLRKNSGKYYSTGNTIFKIEFTEVKPKN